MSTKPQKQPPQNQPIVRLADQDTTVEQVRGTVETTDGAVVEGVQENTLLEPAMRAPSLDEIAAMQAKLKALEADRERLLERIEDLDDEPAEMRASLRPSVDVLLRDLPPGYSPKELEQLAAGILKKAGHAGKSPTGKHIAKHAFLRDILEEHSGKPIRVAPGTVLDDLTPEEVAHLTKHKAIEPEYA